VVLKTLTVGSDAEISGHPYLAYSVHTDLSQKQPIFSVPNNNIQASAMAVSQGREDFPKLPETQDTETITEAMSA
jgi:hypothetical protein